jgi:rhodanese-related sulfurtransferase
MEEETVTRLARVGFSKMEGYLKGGFAAWEKAGENVDLIINVEADELAMDIPFDDHLQVVDVRRETEFAEGHVKGAINLPLTDLTNIALIAGLEENQNLYVHCAGGYRSVIASSILKKEGIHNLRNVVGGWDKIKEEKKIKIEIDASVLN